MRLPTRSRRSTGVRVPYLVGTMVETPRAALIAGELADTGRISCPSARTT